VEGHEQKNVYGALRKFVTSKLPTGAFQI